MLLSTAISKSGSKKASLFFLLTFSLLTACEKEETKDYIDPNSTEMKNRLLSGNDCKSFYRILHGRKKEDFRAVKQTADLGYILCGTTETKAQNESDLMVLKTDCFGKTEWMSIIPHPLTDIGYDIIQLKTGGYMVASNYSSSPVGSSIIKHQGRLMKLDQQGKVLWKKPIDTGNQSLFKRIIEISNGDIVVCGHDKSKGSFVLKTDASGNEIWREQFKSDIQLNDMALKDNSNYVVCGSSKPQSIDEIFVAEITPSGNTLWSKSMGNRDIINSYATSISTYNNKIAIGGHFKISENYTIGILKLLGDNGHEIWSTSLSSPKETHVVTTPQGDLLCSGRDESRFYIQKLRIGNGNTIWSKIRSIPPTTVRDMQLTKDNGFIITGNIFINSGNLDGGIFKVDMNGN